LLFFTENVEFFRYFFRFFGFRIFVFFRLFVFSVFSVCFETVCFGCFASIPKQRVSIEPKQTKDPPKKFIREYIWTFFQKFRVVSVYNEQQNDFANFAYICSTNTLVQIVNKAKRNKMLTAPRLLSIFTSF
jgi:hypothetical protein